MNLSQFSPESEVLERHLTNLIHQNIMIAGGVRDGFPAKLAQLNPQNKIILWTWYFDYAKTANKNAPKNLEIIFDAICPKPIGNSIWLFYWTKNKKEDFQQLHSLLNHAKIGQRLYIIGENRTGIKSVEKLIGEFGYLQKIDSARRCSLYAFEVHTKIPELSPSYKTYSINMEPQIEIPILSGVFSAENLDAGTALLLKTFDKPLKGNVLDIGCGAGVIGTVAKVLNPKINITMADIHAQAIACSRYALERNKITGNVIASDVFSEITEKYDVILSNPPFHAGRNTDYDAVNRLISQAKQHLNTGGELRIVANRHLPYPDLLDNYFGSHDVLAQTTKFCVYSVKK